MNTDLKIIIIIILFLLTISIFSYLHAIDFDDKITSDCEFLYKYRGRGNDRKNYIDMCVNNKNTTFRKFNQYINDCKNFNSYGNGIFIIILILIYYFFLKSDDNNNNNK